MTYYLRILSNRVGKYNFFVIIYAEREFDQGSEGGCGGGDGGGGKGLGESSS